MTFEERTGGTAEQQRQFFEIHVSALKPWVFPLSLSLLLTSVTTKGALARFLFRKAAEVDIELFEVIIYLSGVAILVPLMSANSS
jgi:hypothetical protein